MYRRLLYKMNVGAEKAHYIFSSSDCLFAFFFSRSLIFVRWEPTCVKKNKKKCHSRRSRWAIVKLNDQAVINCYFHTALGLFSNSNVMFSSSSLRWHLENVSNTNVIVSLLSFFFLFSFRNTGDALANLTERWSITLLMTLLKKCF